MKGHTYLFILLRVPQLGTHMFTERVAEKACPHTNSSAFIHRVEE